MSGTRSMTTGSDTGLMMTSEMDGWTTDPDESPARSWPPVGLHLASSSGVTWGWEREYFTRARICPCDPTQGHSCEICDGSRA